MSAVRELDEAIRDLGRALWSTIEPTIRRVVRWLARQGDDD